MTNGTQAKQPLNELPAGVKENLAPGENVIDYLKTFAIISKPDYIILTNMRLIHFNEKHLGRYDFKSMPFQKLLQMKANRGIFLWGNISLKSEEGELIRLSLVSREKMEGFIDSLKTAYGNIAVEPISVAFNKKLFGRATWEFNKPAEMLFRQSTAPDKQSDDPLNQLKVRYIKGEINEAEYKEKLRVLKGE